MKLKVVKVEIVDYDAGSEILFEYALVNPDQKKLAELKHMIEHRSDAFFNENATDEEIEAAEEFNDNIWENVVKFIAENFVVLDIDETYEISY